MMFDKSHWERGACKTLVMIVIRNEETTTTTTSTTSPLTGTPE
jgi:hypothetical protein